VMREGMQNGEVRPRHILQNRTLFGTPCSIWAGC
jgi:hypothetical protein